MGVRVDDNMIFSFVVGLSGVVSETPGETSPGAFVLLNR
jgi:hypothetical protein